MISIDLIVPRRFDTVSLRWSRECLDSVSRTSSMGMATRSVRLLPPASVLTWQTSSSRVARAASCSWSRKADVCADWVYARAASARTTRRDMKKRRKRGAGAGRAGVFPSMASAASPLVWRFSQVFGDKAGEGEIAEGLFPGPEASEGCEMMGGYHRLLLVVHTFFRSHPVQPMSSRPCNSTTTASILPPATRAGEWCFLSGRMSLMYVWFNRRATQSHSHLLCRALNTDSTLSFRATSLSLTT